MPFALSFTPGNLGERGDLTEPEVVDPTPGLGNCSEQSIVLLVEGLFWRASLRASDFLVAHPSPSAILRSSIARPIQSSIDW